MSMIERVSAAMWEKRRERLEGTKWGGLVAWEAETEELRDEVRADARAAIEAMREPTDEMMAAVGKTSLQGRIWHLMIAAALYTGHASDCAVHNEPAFPAGPCDCGAALKGEAE